MYSANRAYEASVQVRGRPVKEVHHRGRTYIEGRQGTEYALSFRNTSNRRVLVIPSVDGLCVIDGKPAGRNSPGFIVEPHGSIDIPGWMVDTHTAAKFTFWPQDARGEQTYIESLYKSGATVDVGNQGLIGFLVLDEHHPQKDHALWNQAGFNTGGASVYRGIACSTNGGMSQNLGTASSNMTDLGVERGMGTKFGEATDFSTRTGEFKRGATVGEIVIEYDTLRGLKDRGVPTQFFTGTDKLYGERSAFPADNAGGCTPPAGWRK